MEDNKNAGSDPDTNTVEDSQEDYYELISAVDLDTVNVDGNDEEDNYRPIGGDGLSNGHCMETGEGISSVSIKEDAEPECESGEETEIRRAFEEDERRRRSPLMAENAARVMEAMRAISFPGTAPDWASEDSWIDQLRRLRSTSHKTTHKTGTKRILIGYLSQDDGKKIGGVLKLIGTNGM